MSTRRSPNNKGYMLKVKVNFSTQHNKQTNTTLNSFSGSEILMIYLFGALNTYN